MKSYFQDGGPKLLCKQMFVCYDLTTVYVFYVLSWDCMYFFLYFVLCTFSIVHLCAIDTRLINATWLLACSIIQKSAHIWRTHTCTCSVCPARAACTSYPVAILFLHFLIHSTFVFVMLPVERVGGKWPKLPTNPPKRSDGQLTKKNN